MPSEHERLFAASGLPDLMDHFGVSVEYRPAGGVGVSMTALAGAERTEEVLDGDDRVLQRVRTFTVWKNAASGYGGVAAPSTKGQISYDGVLYAVASIEAEDSVTATLKCVRKGRMETNRPEIGGAKG